MHCLSCGSADLIQNLIVKIDKKAYRCRKCRLVFLWPQPSTEDIESIYDKDYYKSWGVFDGQEDAVAEMKKKTYARYLKKASTFFSRGKLLDIGSAMGYLLEEAEDRGFDVRGVELSAWSCAVARRRFGSKIHEGKLEDAKYPDCYFDIITMFDLIEHVPDPVSFLHEVRRIIRPDGIVVITTPDTASLSYLLLGKKFWFHWKLEHLLYFDRQSLQYLAERAGFVIVEKTRAYKCMSLKYLQSQFKIFKHPIFGPLVNFLDKIMPEFLKVMLFPVSGGEMFVVLKAV